MTRRLIRGLFSLLSMLCTVSVCTHTVECTFRLSLRLTYTDKPRSHCSDYWLKIKN